MDKSLKKFWRNWSSEEAWDSMQGGEQKFQWNDGWTSKENVPGE